MKNFIKKVLEKSKEVQFSRYAVFLQGLVNRAESVFKSPQWQRLVYNPRRLDKATRVECRIGIWKFSYWREKTNKYDIGASRLVSEINLIFQREGIKDWVMVLIGDLFQGSVARFYLSRATTPLTLGASSLEEAIEIITQILCLKGFYPTDVVLYEGEKRVDTNILQWANENPNQNDIYELQNLLTWGEQESVIDTYVEPAIKEATKEPAHPVEKITSTFEKLLKFIVIAGIIYLLLKSGILDRIFSEIKTRVKKQS